MSDEQNVDPLAILDELIKVRETLRGVVAGFIEDGYTEREARAITCRIFTNRTDLSDETDGAS